MSSKTSLKVTVVSLETVFWVNSYFFRFLFVINRSEVETALYNLCKLCSRLPALRLENSYFDRAQKRGRVFF